MPSTHRLAAFAACAIATAPVAAVRNVDTDDLSSSASSSFVRTCLSQGYPTLEHVRSCVDQLVTHCLQSRYQLRQSVDIDSGTLWASMQTFGGLINMDVGAEIVELQEAELATSEFRAILKQKAWVENDVNLAVDSELRDAFAQPTRPVLTTVLGPSGSGKSFIVRHSQLVDIQKPFFILDGALVRDKVDERLQDTESSIAPRVSYVYQQFALHLPRAAGAIGFKDYHKLCFEKTKYKPLMLEMFKGYNIVFPSTAVPPSKAEEVINKIQGFETPYHVKFVAVTAPLAEVQAAGGARMKEEGKYFSTEGYGPALAAVAYLKGVYHDRPWTFIENYPHTKKPPKVLDGFWGTLTNVLKA